MVVGLLNANPIVYKKKERRARNVPTVIDEYAVEPIDEQEIFGILFLKHVWLCTIFWSILVFFLG